MGLELGRMGGRGLVNLVLEDTGGKGIGKNRIEAGEVTMVVADAPTMDSLVKRYGAFGGWGITAGKVVVLLVITEFDVGRSAEAYLVKMYVNIMGGEDGPSKTDRIVTIEMLKEKVYFTFQFHFQGY